MRLNYAKVVVSDDGLKVMLPLTIAKGKVRLKERSFFARNGLPVFGRSQNITQTCYVEWQIGFDLLVNDKNKKKTSLKRMTFNNNNGKPKWAYELSEILYYSAKMGMLSLEQIKDAYRYVASIAEADTLEMRHDMQICRTHALEDTVNDMRFYRMTVCVCAEVVTKEKQYAAGTQPMLYVCLPITSLQFKKNIIGRSLDAKETADWVIGEEEASLSLELFRIFGMLSPNHRFDVLAILKMLFPQVGDV